MPQIMIVQHRLWVAISDADAILLKMACGGFEADQGDGTFSFDLSSRFKLDEFAQAHCPTIRYRWIELCAVEVATEEARRGLNGALGSRLLDHWEACDDPTVGRHLG